ncbi:MAG: hypothetical protein KKE20_03770, partial [Nanoarchaeota archaeon]|nr:hypothetical protein [Nanoarchaeota archaeon]
SGFRLASIWPLALVMVFFTFGLAFYNFIKGGACERGVGMLAFAFLFFFFQALVPSLTAWFARHSNQYVRLIWSIMLLVAIVCLVAGVIELLRCLGVGSGSGGGGSGPSGPSPGPGPIPGPGPSPRPEPGPGENPDFSEALSLLSNLINQYETAFNKFKTRCNDVLQTNYEFLNSGGYHGGSKPPVSAEQWQKVTDSLNELSDISNQINNLLSSITSHPKFSLIINKDNTLLVNLSSKYSALIKSMQEFYVNFMDRYRKGKPPTP